MGPTSATLGLCVLWHQPLVSHSTSNTGHPPDASTKPIPGSNPTQQSPLVPARARSTQGCRKRRGCAARGAWASWLRYLGCHQCKSFTLIPSDLDLTFKESFKLPQNSLVIILITCVSRNNTHSVNSGSQNVFFNCSEEKTANSSTA